MKISYFKREHRSGLVESLATSVEITEQEFKNLLKDRNNEYDYYCFDERCQQVIFLGKYELKYMFLCIQIENEVEEQ